nr:MAG TPA: hypothetical protein [Caudoviricetes sp.]
MKPFHLDLLRLCNSHNNLVTNRTLVHHRNHRKHLHQHR